LPLTVYRLVKEAKGAGALPKGPQNFLDGLTLSPEAAKEFSPLKLDGRPLVDFVSQPERVVAALISAEKNNAYGQSATFRSHAASADPRLLMENFELNNALALALGINLKLNAAEPALLPGTKAKFQLTISNDGTKAAVVKRSWIAEKETKI